MALYKAIDTSPRFLAVDLEKQLLPGSFEHAVHHLLDHEFDLSGPPGTPGTGSGLAKQHSPIFTRIFI